MATAPGVEFRDEDRRAPTLRRLQYRTTAIPPDFAVPLLSHGPSWRTAATIAGDQGGDPNLVRPRRNARWAGTGQPLARSIWVPFPTAESLLQTKS